MLRARLLTATGLVLAVCLGQTAWAEKPKIAILGLEAAPGAQGVEPDTTDLARKLTKELRARAKLGGGGYTVAPNSDKELTDEKLLMSCDNEAPACMAVIGAGLAAQVVMYGRVEKKADSYKVTLKLLDVKAKALADQTGGDLPIDGPIAPFAKKLYLKLAPEDTPSSLVVTANSDHGRVMIDEGLKGKLVHGTATITGLSDGRHTVGIESDGYERYQQTVVIHRGEATELTAKLVEKERGGGGGGGDGKKSHVSRNLFFGGATLTALALGFVGYSYRGYQTSQKRITIATVDGFVNPRTDDFTDKDCGKTADQVAAEGVYIRQDELDKSCKFQKWTNYGWAATAGLGVFSAVMLILWLRDGGDEQPPVAARKKPGEVAIVPVLTQDTQGAALTIRW